MQISHYLYQFRYDDSERALSRLESKYLFNREEKNKLLISDIKTEPSSSAFIKNRLDIIAFSDDYAVLIDEIKNKKIFDDRYKVEYLVLHGDKTEYAERLKKINETGCCIDGVAEYYSPATIYAICRFDGIWYFGILIKGHLLWQKHKNKPRSCSNSISMSIAKALVNIATRSNKACTLLDACCGVGTIMLEACVAGYAVEGCDINWKMCVDARKNIAHYNYTAKVYRSDIKDMDTQYDVAIIDLPYNLFSNASETEMAHIVESAYKIADRLLIISAPDISAIIRNTGVRITDYCSVGKNGKTTFSRNIWVCEKTG